MPNCNEAYALVVSVEQPNAFAVVGDVCLVRVDPEKNLLITDTLDRARLDVVDVEL